MFRQQGRLLPAFELNLFKNALGFLLLIPTLVLVEGLSLPDYSLPDLGVTLLSGCLGIAVADTWYLRALNLMGASRSSIVASLLSPFRDPAVCTFPGRITPGMANSRFNARHGGDSAGDVETQAVKC